MADPISVSLRNTNQLDYNISDVIDIIKEDCQDFSSDYAGVVQVGGGDGTVSEANCSVVSRESHNDPDYDSKRKAYVRIVEQPQPKALRFRYLCEGRSAGSIPGVRSTGESKTFPAIQVMGYKGPAVVVVSCVTVDPPYRPHPHNLVGKEGCKKGVCTMTIQNDSMHCVFSNLGIQCVKKRDVDDALKLREDIRVDPFQTSFAHRNQPQSIDLNSLRLCFQVFLEGSEKGKFTHPLKPIVSDPIYDKKATADLIICKLSDCTSSVAGGKEIILLCDKVTKEDIHVRFYEVKDGMVEWEAFGDFQASDVHKQVAISFKTPRYKSLEVENPVRVYVELLRPSDKSTSEPRPFQYLPLDSDPLYVKRKVAKLGNSSNTDKIGKFFAENVGHAVYGETGIPGATGGMPGATGGMPGATAGMPCPSQGTGTIPRHFIQAHRTKFQDRIKNEPQDIASPVSPLMTMVRSPSSQSVSQHYGGGTLYTVPSQAPSPISSGMYYPHQSPAHSEGVPAGGMVPSPGLPDPRVASPAHQQYYPSAQSPYSDAGHGNVILGNYAPSVASPPQGPAISHLLDLDSRKCIEQNPIELDMNNINSAELRSLLPSENDLNISMVDAHLSENLSSNLSLIDHPPHINKLNSKSGFGMSVTTPYIQNIPPEPKPEVDEPSTSDSFNNLKSELEFFNQWSSKR